MSCVLSCVLRENSVEGQVQTGAEAGVVHADHLLTTATFKVRSLPRATGCKSVDSHTRLHSSSLWKMSYCLRVQESTPGNGGWRDARASQEDRYTLKQQLRKASVCEMREYNLSRESLPGWDGGSGG